METRAHLRTSPRSPRDVARLAEYRCQTRLRHRGQGRARSDRRSLPSQCPGRRRAYAVHGRHGRRGPACFGRCPRLVRGADMAGLAAQFLVQVLELIGLADPLRPSVPDAVSECRSAGIKVIMITGDYPTTARAIARQAGFDTEDFVTGTEVEQLTNGELAVRVRTATVFARIMPEQKLRIVNALKANGEIVAMTGDGVNDAPSLKAAHIGIAMGGRGTDVAREASSIVLLDDDFGSIVNRTARPPHLR